MADSEPKALSSRAMSREAKAISGLDFTSFISGPMTAAIEAQTAAGLELFKFIKQVGFEQTPMSAVASSFTGPIADMFSNQTGKPMMITINYEKADSTGDNISGSLTIPFLCMVPLPALRLDSLTIDFMARIQSMERNESEFFDEVVKEKSKGGGWFGGVVTTVTNTDRTIKKSMFQQTKEYSYQVKVTAVQEAMPRGLERVFDMLENSIKEGEGEPPEGGAF